MQGDRTQPETTLHAIHKNELTVEKVEYKAEVENFFSGNGT